MAIFREIERRLENLVEGFFNHRFSSALQPIELARKLTGEMDRKQQVSVTHTYSPNIFMLHLAPQDFEELGGFNKVLAKELSEYVKAHAQEKAYRFAGALQISLAPEGELRPGECAIYSHFEEFDEDQASGGTQIIPALELDKAVDATDRTYLLDESSGIEYPLRNQAIAIGRRSDNDIVIDDAGASRYHARIEANGSNFFLVDLESTNGTLLNDEDVGRVRLVNDDRILIGRVELIFRHKASD